MCKWCIVGKINVGLIFNFEIFILKYKNKYSTIKAYTELQIYRI